MSFVLIQTGLPEQNFLIQTRDLYKFCFDPDYITKAKLFDLDWSISVLF